MNVSLILFQEVLLKVGLRYIHVGSSFLFELFPSFFHIKQVPIVVEYLFFLMLESWFYSSATLQNDIIIS